MIAHYMIITLCGSPEFKEAFRTEEENLTLAGYIVLTPGYYGETGDEDMQKRKIDIADAVYVINKGGFIDDKTKSEIDYAEKTGKEVYYMEEE